MDWDEQKKTIWDILEIAIDQAALRGQLVMIDMHNLEPQKPTELWVRHSSPSPLPLPLAMRLTPPLS